MHQTIILKKVNRVWEGAIVKDNRFERGINGETLEEAALKGLVGILSRELDEGSTISFEIRTDSAEELARAHALEDATNAEREASAELAKLEATKAAREKIRAAREALKKETEREQG